MGYEGSKLKTIASEAEEQKLLADLEKYRKMLVDLGIKDEDVKIIPTSVIAQRIRARYSAVFPRQQAENTSYLKKMAFNIPWKYAQEILHSYRYCIITRIPNPENLNVTTGPAAAGVLMSCINWYGKVWSDEDVEYWKKVQERRAGQPVHQRQFALIVQEIEKQARKDGYQFAIRGVSGACTHICRDAGFPEVCVALNTGICRFAGTGKSRPCGTAAVWGVDYPATCARMGWYNWIQGWSAFPEDFPPGTLDPPIYYIPIIFID